MAAPVEEVTNSHPKAAAEVMVMGWTAAAMVAAATAAVVRVVEGSAVAERVAAGLAAEAAEEGR